MRPILLFILLYPFALHALEFTVCAKKWECSLENKINAQEIDTSQYRTAESLLATFPGVFVRNEGGMTRVSIRGAKTDQTLVLINGIPINDPSDPNNAFDFSTIETEDIEEIKVYTGAEALEYGSSAIGGVIAVKTKKGHGIQSQKGRVELGSSKTINATVGAQGEESGHTYYVNTVVKRTGRGSRFNPLHGNDVSNFNKDLNAETRVATHLHENWIIELFAHGNRQNVHIDGFQMNGLPHEIGNRGMKKSDMLAFKNQILLLNNCWLHTVDASHMDISRRYWYPLNRHRVHIEGHRHLVRYQTSYKATDCFKILAETAWQQDQEKTAGLEKSLDLSYLKVKAEGLTMQEHCFTLAGRIDKVQKISPHKTIQATALVRFTPTMIFKASAGTGFRAPSLQDIFGFPPFQLPNFNLRPEHSKNIEITLANNLIHTVLKAEVTIFYNRIQNIIVWVPSLRQMINRNHRLSQGIEAKAVVNPCQGWSLIGSYTLIHARDYSPKQPVFRQPQHKITFNALWQATCELQFFSGIVFESSRQDRTFLKRVKLPPTTDVRVGCNYQLIEAITLFSRTENLLNQKREQVYGYGRGRRALVIGVRIVM